MKWTKLTIDTTCEAEDLISAFLEEEGVLGVQIEDNIPLTEEEMETMFVDLLPDDVPENDGTARVTCFLDDTFDVQEIKDKVTAEIKRLSEFLSVGTGNITESETKDEDWRDNWKAYFKPFRLYDNIIIIIICNCHFIARLQMICHACSITRYTDGNKSFPLCNRFI